MTIRNQLICGVLLSVSILTSSSAHADTSGDWKFGIGTGLASFSLDGDLGFATPLGGFVADVDLDNSDTADLLESGFGVQGFATNGTWTFLLLYGTNTLEDQTSEIRAEWDRTSGELSAIYNFAQTGDHRWGVLAGVRYTDHEWEISSRQGAFTDVEPEDDWTDYIVGLTHQVPFSDRWSWRSRFDAGFGDSEEAYLASTGVFWQPNDNWLFNANLKYTSVEFGDRDDITHPDFYFYDVEEPSIGLGLMFTW
jgi:hypothetical protein